MTGLPIVLGNDRSPNETFMQVAGNGDASLPTSCERLSHKVARLN